MFRVDLVGDVALIGRFERMPGSIQHELEIEARLLGINLAAYIVREKLQGQVLNHVSGKLGQSIAERPVTVEAGVVWGGAIQSGNVKYGRIHEDGFVGDELVKAHTRSMVFGRLVAPFTVGAFTRRMNMPARPYMKPSLAENEPKIRDGFRGAVVRGTNAP